MKSLLTAISLLSILPVPERWTKNISTSALYFPLVGMLIGTIYWLTGVGLSRAGVSAPWSSIWILLAMITLTRAFHLDGLADMADGFWGGQTRDKILRIMKDSATGVFGVVALIMILLVKWTAVRLIVDKNIFWILIPAAMVSRFSMLVLSGWLPYARDEGTGHDIISNTSAKHVIMSMAGLIILMTLLFGMGSLILIFMGIVISILIGNYSRIKINGITGDILGATCEMTEAALLAITPFLQTYFFPEYWNFPLLVYVR